MSYRMADERRKTLARFLGLSDQADRVKSSSKSDDGLRSFVVETGLKGIDATFRLNIGKATTLTELCDAAVKYATKVEAEEASAKDAGGDNQRARVASKPSRIVRQ